MFSHNRFSFGADGTEAISGLHRSLGLPVGAPCIFLILVDSIIEIITEKG